MGKDSATALEAVLSGAAATAGEAEKPHAPRKPRARRATANTRATAKATKTGARSPAPKAVEKLPPAIAKVLAKATAKQVAVARRILGYDSGAVFQRPDSDGDIIVRYVPSWEQGRMKNGERVKGPGRMFVYLVDKNGELSGHGYRYRSSAAEAKLRPLEERNAARLERAARKEAKAA